MCGIAGVLNDGEMLRRDTLKHSIILPLLKSVQRRGSDGFGMYLRTPRINIISKTYLKPLDFFRTKEFEIILNIMLESTSFALFLQSRLATNNFLDLSNQHPVLYEDKFIFHNGIYLDSEIYENSKIDISDTKILIRDLYENKVNIKNLTETSYIFGDLLGREIRVFTNTGSLYEYKTKNITIINSEPIFKQKFANAVQNKINNVEIKTLPEGLSKDYPIVIEMGVKNGKFNEGENCVRCGISSVIPGYFPFNEGKCRYCENKSNDSDKEVKSLSKLEDLIFSKSNDARVVVGFSGGRDSSFGVIKLKKTMKLQPIAVSYDWGGLTDLGRRNQSRICGRLGVEHVWYSADLEKNRKSIRRDLEAWCSKPSLKTLQIVLSEDKLMWKVPRQIAREREISNVIYFTNPYEKTIFKIAVLGIKHNFEGNRPQSLGFMNKIKLILKYGIEVILNPKFINSNLLNHIRAFMYFYRDSFQSIQFFDYYQWDEEEVNDTLKKEVEWESRDDLHTTWRIGDATTPFYNFVYLKALGFTENETLRANQVRNGLISIGKANQLNDLERVVDWDGLNEYTRIIGLTTHEILRATERLVRKTNPKLEI
jgi:glucosamine--fructose-6-phosphate aminotransferase (isomerizing)